MLDLSCVTGAALDGASTRSGVPNPTASGGSRAGENGSNRSIADVKFCVALGIGLVLGIHLR